MNAAKDLLVAAKWASAVEPELPWWGAHRVQTPLQLPSSCGGCMHHGSGTPGQAWLHLCHGRMVSMQWQRDGDDGWSQWSSLGTAGCCETSFSILHPGERECLCVRETVPTRRTATCHVAGDWCISGEKEKEKGGGVCWRQAVMSDCLYWFPSGDNHQHHPRFTLCTDFLERYLLTLLKARLHFTDRCPCCGFIS